MSDTTHHDGKNLTDDKLRAELAKLIAETRSLNEGQEKARAEVHKLIAEAGHLRVQTFVAPFLAAAAVIGATAAVMRLFGGP